MCGIFGFDGDTPDEAVLLSVARLAARRGPDAYGWTHGRGINVGLGKPSEQDWRRLGCAPGPLVGHFRLATVGGRSATRIEDVQPIRASGWTVAHNGVVRRADAIAEQFGFSYDTYNDSEALPRLAGRYGSIGRAVEAAGLDRYALLALSPEGRVYALCDGLPLWRLDRPEGAYFSSGRMTGGRAVEPGIYAAA